MWGIRKAGIGNQNSTMDGSTIEYWRLLLLFDSVGYARLTIDEHSMVDC
jgi:hypothetical protein